MAQNSINDIIKDKYENGTKKFLSPDDKIIVSEYIKISIAEALENKKYNLIMFKRLVIALIIISFMFSVAYTFRLISDSNRYENEVIADSHQRCLNLYDENEKLKDINDAYKIEQKAKAMERSNDILNSIKKDWCSSQ